LKLLSESELLGLLPPAANIAAVEEALRAYAAYGSLMPARQHIDWESGTMLVMPAVASRGIGVKLISVVPDNVTRQLPVTNGLMILNDRDTGMPLSLMNGGALTALRTGAVGSLGVKYMTPEDLETVGVIGTGVQGLWQAIFACAVRPIKRVFYVARSAASGARFVQTLEREVRGVRVTGCENATELLRRTNLVIAATTSNSPVLPDEATLLEGKHFISIGSFKPSMQELPLSVFPMAKRLAIDSEAARHEVGDVINPVAQGLLRTGDVFHIADLVTGRTAVDVNGTTAYKCVGMALFDLFVARALYDAALNQRVGTDFQL
jgi:ornithine cyclodeaminase